jgi:phage-related protein
VKEAIFHDKALVALREFPDEAKKETGQAIRDLQRGMALEMPLSRPMPSIGIGVSEIRVRDREGIYRTFYYVKSFKGILVFHAFVKKTQKTPSKEIEIARKRLREMLNEEKK